MPDAAGLAFKVPDADGLRDDALGVGGMTNRRLTFLHGRHLDQVKGRRSRHQHQINDIGDRPGRRIPLGCILLGCGHTGESGNGQGAGAEKQDKPSIHQKHPAKTTRNCAGNTLLYNIYVFL